MLKKRGVLAAAVGVCASALAALGQGVCGSWTTELAEAGANGDVSAMTRWDPDGAGPLPEWLVVAGTFTVVGGVQTGQVAGWDGVAWHAMGAGLGPVSAARKLLVMGSDLYLVGTLGPGSTGPTAARYSGGVWQQIDSPTGSATDADSSGTELVMVGTFAARTGKNSSTLARWIPGTGWSSFGTVGGARAVVFHAGSWYVSGVMGSNSPRVAVRSAGGTWDALTPLEDDSEWSSPPTGLFSAGGELWAIGSLVQPNGTGDALRYEGGVWVQRGEDAPQGALGRGHVADGVLYREVPGAAYGLIRRSADSWEGVASGVFAGSVGGVARYGGALHAGARTESGGRGPSVLEGGAWHVVGDGLSGLPSTAVKWRGKAVIGGTLTRLNGEQLSGLIARDSRGWSPLGDALAWSRAPGVAAMVVHGDELVVSGNLASGSGVVLSRVAAWNGVAWRSVGDGLPVVPGALASDGGTLYAAGYASADGAAPGALLTVWRHVGAGWERVGGAVASGGTVPLLGVGGGVLSVSGVSAVSGNPGTVRVNYTFDGTGWVGGPVASGGRLGNYAVQGGALMLAGETHAGQGIYDLTVVTAGGLVARPFGYQSSSAYTVYASAYREGLVVSGRFFSLDRAVFVPAVGDGVALPNPGGVVRALADDGVEGFAVVYSDAGGVIVSRLSCSCSAADVASVGGVRGGDGVIDVNDLIVFIDLFFEGNWRGDVGAVGGVPGSDGALDNNDFVVYIDRFFAGCGG